MQVYDIPIDPEQREETQHGTFAFPLAIYETDLQKNILGYVHWHWHEELQFSYMQKGSADFFVGQEKITLQTGDGIFINSGVLHQIRPHQRNQRNAYVCLDVHPALLRGFPGSIIDQKYLRPYLQNSSFSYKYLPHSAAETRPLLQRLQEIHQLYTCQEDGYELSILIRLLQAWKDLLSLEPERIAVAAPEQDQQRLKTMLTLIQEHYPEKLTLQDFSAAVHLCDSQCCRLFRQYMHCTLFAYLLEYRLERSMEALLVSAAPISRIAYEHGFSTTSSYISRFRQKTGCTPLAFRKKQGTPAGGTE